MNTYIVLRAKRVEGIQLMIRPRDSLTDIAYNSIAGDTLHIVAGEGFEGHVTPADIQLLRDEVDFQFAAGFCMALQYTTETTM